jgi:AraC-like DNA-binding protein
MAFSLAPALLAVPVQAALPEATGELVWLPWQAQPASPTPAVHPALLVHAPYASPQVEHVTIMPDLHAHDPLLDHMALVLQAAIEGEDEAGRLYAAVLADALVVHFFRRYAASCSALGQAIGGLVPSKLRRVIIYIQGHLEQALSLSTLADVAQMSPAHFARLFKQATGRTPHQYVITCRMAYAKRLLAETDMPLSEIGPEVGCADQSHFTALFRKHVSTTPKSTETSHKGRYDRHVAWEVCSAHAHALHMIPTCVARMLQTARAPVSTFSSRPTLWGSPHDWGQGATLLRRVPQVPQVLKVVDA